MLREEWRMTLSAGEALAMKQEWRREYFIQEANTQKTAKQEER